MTNNFSNLTYRIYFCEKLSLTRQRSNFNKWPRMHIDVRKGVFFYRTTQKEVAIGIFANYELTGHRIGEK